MLRQREVVIIASPGIHPCFIAETAEVGIGEMRMPMDGNSQDIRPVVKDILLAVAMMIINVKDSNLTVGAEVMGRNGR